MSLPELLEYCKENMLMSSLIQIKGFKEKTCIKIQKGVISKINLIYFLLDTLNIKEEKNQPYKGQVCFSKIRDDIFEKLLIEKGYEISDNINKNTKILIVPSLDISSSKIEKAKKYNIEIITLDDIYKKI